MSQARALLVPALFLGVLIAGCVSDVAEPVAPTDDARPLAGLSEARFDVLPGESHWVEATSDGVEMHVRVFLPDTTPEPDWKAPTILVMSPYFGFDDREDPADPASPPQYWRYQGLIDHFGARGYAVAFADVRGTGDSGGCLEQTAVLQRQDGHDIIEWLGTRDWSNGKVGMYGISYDAETQQGSAITAPPHLTTIIPVASVSGQYEWNFYDGVPFTLHALSGNLFYMVGDGIQPPTTVEGAVQYPERFECQPSMLAQGLKRDGDWDQYWEDREIRRGVENIEASVLYVHGLQDWNVRQVAIRDWFDRIPSEKRAIFGQWMHNFPDGNSFEPEWSRQDWQEIVHKWYDYWLLGLDNGILDEMPPVQIQDSDGAWRAEQAYPPADAAPWTLHLTRDGGLAPGDAAAWEEPLLLRENEEAFVWEQTCFSRLCPPAPEVDTSPVETMLAFTSEPLPADLRFSGWPTMTFEALLFDGLYPDSDTVTDAHFAANLWMVDADGEETWLNSGYISARHRDGVDAPKTVPEDERIVYDLRFHPGDTVIPAGSRIVAALSGSDRWTEPEGTMWGAEVWGGSITFPSVARDLSVVGLDVPLGEPVRG